MVVDQRKEEREGEGEREGGREGRKNLHFLSNHGGLSLYLQATCPLEQKRCRKVNCLSPFYPFPPPKAIVVFCGSTC